MATLPLLTTARSWLSQILQAATNLVIARQQVDVIFEAQNRQDPEQDPDAGRHLPSLQAREGVARHIDPGGKLVEGHATAQAGKAQTFPQRRGAALGLRKER